MRDRTIDRYGGVEEIGEKKWVAKYVDTRKDWLANHSIKILNKTIYRMEAFQRLIDQEKWGLELPFTVRGIRIDEDVLGGRPIRVSAIDAEERLLFLRTPYMRGEDVRAVQQTLKNDGFEIEVDGIWGPGTDKAVRTFQQRVGLTVDGIAGPATLAALGV
jgi:chitosanase